MCPVAQSACQASSRPFGTAMRASKRVSERESESEREEILSLPAEMTEEFARFAEVACGCKAP